MEVKYETYLNHCILNHCITRQKLSSFAQVVRYGGHFEFAFHGQPYWFFFGHLNFWILDALTYMCAKYFYGYLPHKFNDGIAMQIYMGFDILKLDLCAKSYDRSWSTESMKGVAL